VSAGWHLAKEGMARADDAESDAWKGRADNALERLASTGHEFTAEDLRKLAGSPIHQNAIGARFRAAALAKVIERVGYRLATRPSRHSHPIAVWKGVAP
jgi:hypothetical protein